ncbi:MAG: TIR domain-containing protein [Ktedonobacteraceae bacterium]
MKIFISYRRKSWPFVHLLVEKLRERIKGDIFVDYTSIDDTDFERSILRHLRESDIVLVVVTELTFVFDRIHNDDDWVRREIALALDLKKPIILIRVDNLLPPPPSNLPDNIRNITRMQGIAFYPEYFDAAVWKLAEFITGVVPSIALSKENNSLIQADDNIVPQSTLSRISSLSKREQLKQAGLLEQLWYTWSPIGLGNVTGFRVRAASDGLTDLNSERSRSFRGHLNYDLPQGTDPYTTTNETSPVCLAFIDPSIEGNKDPNDKGNKHIVMRKVYTGKDAYGRPGVYFVHLLDLLNETPNDFVASDAIELWESHFWRTSDATQQPPDSLRLDRVGKNELPKGSLTEYDMREVGEYLPFVIEAFLSLKADQKLYIAAPTTQVAALIWGLTHSLPRSLQLKQKLTFSTYEQDVNKAAVRVVGTCRASSQEQNGYARTQQLLPADCFHGRGLALDCYTGKRSELEQGTQVAAYANYAADCLLTGQKKMFAHLLDTANEMNVEDTGSFMVFFKTYSDAQLRGLTQEDVTGLLKNYKLATELLTQEGVQRTIIDLSIRNPQWWIEDGEPAIKHLRSPFDAASGKKAKVALASLATKAATVTCDAMLRNDTATSEASLKILITSAPSDVDSGPWVHLLCCFSQRTSKDPKFRPDAAFSWEMHSWFLKQWAYGVDSIDDDLIRPWLQMSWIDFRTFLLLKEKIPTKWYQLALIELLNSSSQQIPQLAIYLLNSYPMLFESVLRWLMREKNAQPAVFRFFTKLMEHGYKGKVKLLVTLLSVETANPVDMDAFLHAARLDSKEKMLLLERHSPELLSHGLTPLLIELISLYMKELTPDKLGNTSTQNTLLLLQRLPLPGNLALPVRHWNRIIESHLSLEGSMQLPIEKAYLQQMGEAIHYFELQKNKNYMGDFLYLLIKNKRSQDELRCIVESLAPALTEAETKTEAQRQLLQQLAVHMGEGYMRELSFQWLLPYIALALEYALSLKSAGRWRFLEPLLTVLLKNVDGDDFAAIERQIHTWRNDYRQEWNAYSSTLRPKSLVEKVGELGGNIWKMLPSRSQQDQPSPQQSEIQQSQPPVQNRAAFQPQSATETQLPLQDRGRQQSQAPKGSTGALPLLPSPNDDLPVYVPKEENDPTPQQISSKIVATVNGIPVHQSMLEMVYMLKDLYIPFRIEKLEKTIENYKKKATNIEENADVRWLFEELDELRSHTDCLYTRRVLENDIIIANTLMSYGKQPYNSMLDPRQQLPEVSKEVKKHRDYRKLTSNKYADSDVEAMLLVFLRYRTLALYFQQQQSQISIREWLEDQRRRATIVPGNVQLLADQNTVDTKEDKKRWH